MHGGRGLRRHRARSSGTGRRNFSTGVGAGTPLGTSARRGCQQKGTAALDLGSVTLLAWRARVAWAR